MFSILSVISNTIFTLQCDHQSSIGGHTFVRSTLLFERCTDCVIFNEFILDIFDFQIDRKDFETFDQVSDIVDYGGKKIIRATFMDSSYAEIVTTVYESW